MSLIADVQVTDINSNGDERMQRWRWYLRSLYWVVTVVSTTGFGEIVPQNTQEMLIAIACFFAGAFILSIILSSFTAGMTSITKAHREYLYQVKLLLVSGSGSKFYCACILEMAQQYFLFQKYLNNVGLSEIRQWQVNLYFNVLWDKCRGRKYHEVTYSLPTSLRIEVCNALYADTLGKVLMFQVSTDRSTFLRQVASRVHHSIYLPGVCIVKEGDSGNSMYIVYRGQVSGLVAGNSPLAQKEPELKEVYLVGDVFGKLPCLFQNESYKKSYRAESITEVLELQSKEVRHLAYIYPEFMQMLKAIIASKYVSCV